MDLKRYKIVKESLMILFVPLLIEGDCLPCPRVSKQRCLCGGKVAERLCASPTWQCDVVSYLL